MSEHIFYYIGSFVTYYSMFSLLTGFLYVFWEGPYLKILGSIEELVMRMVLWPVAWITAVISIFRHGITLDSVKIVFSFWFLTVHEAITAKSKSVQKDKK